MAKAGVISTSEAAALLGVAQPEVRRMIKRGDLQCWRFWGWWVCGRLDVEWAAIRVPRGRGPDIALDADAGTPEPASAADRVAPACHWSYGAECRSAQRRVLQAAMTTVSGGPSWKPG